MVLDDADRLVYALKRFEKTMKILHVITSLRIGGAEKLMVDLLPRLRDLGNDVELAIFDGVHTQFVEELKGNGIKIHIFGVNRNVYNPIHLIKLRSYFNHFDIIHTHNTSPQLFAAIDSIGKKTFLCTTEHNTSNRRRNIQGLQWVDKWMYSRYQKIICISDQAEQNLRNYLNSRAPKIITIYNGINLKSFLNAQPDYSLKRNKDKIIITMVAAFRPQKDQPTLIKALKLLPEKYELWLVGYGERKEECEKMCEQEGVNDRVLFWGLRKDIPTILKTSDIIVMSSHYEGLSLSNVEGMSCGRPFIASDVDGLREVVKGYGVLFPHQDYQTLAKEITRLTEDKEYADQIIRQCQAKAGEYDIKVMAEKYNAVYQELCSKRKTKDDKRKAKNERRRESTN